MGNDSDQDDDDDHMTSAENAPNYTNNHHHVVLVEGVNEEIRSGPSRNVGYYDATSLYPSSGVCTGPFLPGGFAGPGALPAQSAASPRTPLLLLLAGPRLAGTSATSQRAVG